MDAIESDKERRACQKRDLQSLPAEKVKRSQWLIVAVASELKSCCSIEE